METQPDTPNLTHRTFEPHLPTLSATRLQALLFDCIEDGPSSLIEPIESEFKRRGLDGYSLLGSAN